MTSLLHHLAGLRSLASRLLFVFLAGSILSGCTLPWKQEFSGLLVQSTEGPGFQVYLDGLHLGQAPIQKDDVKPGVYRIKLDVGDGSKSYEGQIHLYPGAISSVLWNFSGTEPTGTGDIFELEPLSSQTRSELSVVTIPEGSTVQLNTTTYGLSPVIVDEVEPGQYSLALNAVGHVKRTTSVNIAQGFRLNVFSRLARSSDSLDTSELLNPSTPDSTASAGVQTGLGSPAASPTPRPTPMPTNSAGTATNSATVAGISGASVTIKETGTGWLRVRAAASTSGAEVAKVNVGTKHAVRQVQSGWYEIEYEPGKTGWVAGQYVEYAP